MYETNLPALFHFLATSDQNDLLDEADKKTIVKYQPLIDKIKKLNETEQRLIFSSEKMFIKHPFFCKFDSHLLRLELSQIIVNYRRKQIELNFQDPLMVEYQKNGIIVLNNFLDPNEFQKLRSECYQIEKNHKTLTGCLNKTRAELNNRFKELKTPNVAKFVNHPLLNKILLIMTGLKSNEFYASPLSNITLDHLRYREKHDIQTDMHTDTFQPTFRWWFYLNDVKMENGPFHFVKGDHKNSPARLKWEQKMYNKMASTPMNKAYKPDREGSFRNPDPAIKARETAITGPKNTLIIADTHSFHHRGFLKPKHDRFTLFGYSRTNPFYFYTD